MVLYKLDIVQNQYYIYMPLCSSHSWRR